MMKKKRNIFSIIGAVFIVSICLSFAPEKPAAAEGNSGRGEVLFLGHPSKHHDSGMYAPWLSVKLFRSGINLTYTESLGDLTEENLSKYDALIIYANHDSISKPQERALRRFVEGGKGLLAIHSASYCFRNSDWYVRTVGGQFKSHGEGVFHQTIVDRDHPIMRGIEEFSTWDETYIHTKLSSDNVVLGEYVDGTHREPYTWVRNQGKGRVFYTAFGHDERTWKNAGFLDLIRNAVLWAVGEEVQQRINALNIPDVDIYGIDTIGDYTTRKLVKKMQPPLPAEESTKLIQLPPGFEMQLFASEPDITNPIAMSWDELGRLWIVESVDYPNTFRETDGASNDRIKICEDTDGDGRADKFTIFADSLNIPTGIVFANGGVIVSMAPDFLFLKDTDGDDVADERKVIVSGWGKWDTHAGPSNLHYGFDNKIWGVVGYAGFIGKIDSLNRQFGPGLYRFNVDGSGLEFLGNTTNNTWGLGFSENNDAFISTANNTHSAYYSMPQQTVERFMTGNPEGVNPIQKIETHYHSHALTPNIRQWDSFGGFTSSAGHNLYTARTYPQEYWNRVAFVCEPTVRLVHRAVIEPDGAGFTESDNWNLVAGSDEWFGPVQAGVGPDGHVWIADWYNFILLHNIPNPNFLEYVLPTEWMKTGVGNAVITPVRSNSHGRIYRVVYKNGKPTEYPKLSKNDPEGLITALKNDNMFWRMHAQRMLVELGDRTVAGGLLELVDNRSLDAIGLNTAAVHALWTLHGIGLLDGTDSAVLGGVKKALSHPAAGVRKAAASVLPATRESFEALTAHGLLRDSNLNTRLAVFNRIAEYPASDAIGAALWESSNDPVNEGDKWLSKALSGAAARHSDGFLTAANTERSGGGSTLGQKIAAALVSERYTFGHKMVSPFPPDAAKKEIVVSARLGKSEFGELRGFVIGQGDRSNGYALYVRNGQVIFGVKQHGHLVEIASEGPLPELFTVTSKLERSGKTTLAIDGKQVASGMVHGLFSEALVASVRSGADFTDNEKVGHYPGPFEFEGVVEDLQIEFLRESSKEGGAPPTVAAESTTNPASVKAEPKQQAKARQRITLSVVPEKMQFDKKEIKVRAGQPVTLRLENQDGMPHNLVILKPGSLEKVGAAADAMLSDPKAAEKHYVPALPEVLYHTKILNIGDSESIEFVAPDKPGDYPFVCTFPGHWRLMQGILKVE